MATEIYVGPSLPGEGLNQYAVFVGGTPANLQDLYANSDDVDLLTVPMTEAPQKMAATGIPGTPEYAAYLRLSNGIVRNTPPVSSGGGSTSAGTGPIDFVLQNTTTSGNGTSYKPTRPNEVLTFTITGTSNARTVVFEIADPSGVYASVKAMNFNDPTKVSSQTTSGSNASPESWFIEVPIGFTFRARIASVSGGNVSVKGKAVVSDAMAGLLRAVQGLIQQQNMELYGNSADTKPTAGVKVGTTFFEIDSKKVFMFDGTSWGEL